MAPPPDAGHGYPPDYPTQSASQLPPPPTQYRSGPPDSYPPAYQPAPPPPNRASSVLTTAIVVLAVVFGAVLVSLLWTYLSGSDDKPRVVVTVTASGGMPPPTVIPPGPDSTPPHPNQPPPEASPPAENPPPADVDDVSPPSNAIYLNDRLAKANNDATDGFCHNVAVVVRATDYSPGETFLIGARGLNNSKYYEIDCRASRKAGSWVVCGGGNTTGNVQIYVHP